LHAAVPAYGHVSLVVNEAKRPIEHNAVQYRLKGAREEDEGANWLIASVTVLRSAPGCKCFLAWNNASILSQFSDYLVVIVRDRILGETVGHRVPVTPVYGLEVVQDHILHRGSDSKRAERLIRRQYISRLSTAGYRRSCSRDRTVPLIVG
jgi:hypothetical protein